MDHNSEKVDNTPNMPKRRTDQEARTTSQRGNIGLVVSRFIQEIDSLASTLPLAMRSITVARRNAREAYRAFISENGKERNDEDGSVKININDILRFQRLTRRSAQTSAAGVLVPRSFLVALVSQFDSFLGLLIEALLLTKPEILNGSEKTISFPELVSFGSIDAARDHIIEKEVESVLRKSHAEQFEWLEANFAIKLREGLLVWPQFIEVTERRNLFVHTGGQVSAQYLKICKAHKVDCGKTARGDQLTVAPAYFNAAYETIFEVGTKLAHVLWRKLKPDDREEADNQLLSTTYHLLVEEKYSLARALLDFATEVLKKHASEGFRLRFVVNRVQAYKWAGESDKAREILGKEDFSALSNEFQIADAVLREDFDKALFLVRAIGAKGSIRLGDYREWPLFKEFRKHAALESVIEEVFGEPLNKVSVVEEENEASEVSAPTDSAALSASADSQPETSEMSGTTPDSADTSNMDDAISRP